MIIFSLNQNSTVMFVSKIFPLSVHWYILFKHTSTLSWVGRLALGQANIDSTLLKHYLNNPMVVGACVGQVLTVLGHTVGVTQPALPPERCDVRVSPDVVCCTQLPLGRTVHQVQRATLYKWKFLNCKKNGIKRKVPEKLMLTCICYQKHTGTLTKRDTTLFLYIIIIPNFWSNFG